MNLLKQALLLSLSIATVKASVAQNKQYTMAEATNGLYTTLAQKGLSGTSWEPETNKLYHVVKDGDKRAWVSVRFPDMMVDTVLTLDDLNDKLGSATSLKRMPAMHWLSKGEVWTRVGQKLYKGIATDGGYMWSDWLTLPDGAANVTIDDHKNIAYTIKNNLYFISKEGKSVQVTQDEDENIVNGQSVHRNEFGISGGIFLSPQGNFLAYYSMDESMVNDYPIVNWASDPAKAKTIKYPMAGGTSHEVKLKVYNPSTGKNTTLKVEGPKDQYLTCVTWGPDERFVYIAVLNRDQDHMWLNQYEAATGNYVKTLFEETSDKYVEPQHELMFMPDNKNEFIWWSQRDGYMHLYKYNTDGTLIKQLTKGEWIVNSIDGVNEEEKELIITTTKESPIEAHTYTLDWRRGKMKRIDEEAGWHSVSVSDNGNYLLDVYSSGNTPKRTLVRSTDGRFQNVLMESEDPLAEYERPNVRDVELKTDDGTALYGKIIFPTDFDENKKYPVIVYLYNGPHVQLIRNTFPASRNLWYEYLAQHGYIVFTMDGRGSSNRGLAFEQATFGNLGSTEMEDQLKGVEFLKSLKYVDADRMGVHGWSFGGFMTTSLMMRHPGVFKVGVAGGPVIDWSMYEIMYTERYMNSPETNKDGYDANNLLNHVDRLKDKLLIIHGAQDNVVVWQHSMKLIRKSVELGKQIDYFVYPAHPHNVRGKDRVHLMQKITDYFDQYLK